MEEKRIGSVKDRIKSLDLNLEEAGEAKKRLIESEPEYEEIVMMRRNKVRRNPDFLRRRRRSCSIPDVNMWLSPAQPAPVEESFIEIAERLQQSRMRRLQGKTGQSLRSGSRLQEIPQNNVQRSASTDSMRSHAIKEESFLNSPLLPKSDDWIYSLAEDICQVAHSLSKEQRDSLKRGIRASIVSIGPERNIFFEIPDKGGGQELRIYDEVLRISRKPEEIEMKVFKMSGGDLSFESEDSDSDDYVEIDTWITPQQRRELLQKSNSLTRDTMTIDNRVHERGFRRRNLSGPGYLELLNTPVDENTENKEKANMDLIALSQEVTNWTTEKTHNSDLQRIDLEINIPSPTSPLSPTTSRPKSPSTPKSQRMKDDFKWFSKKRLARVGNILDTAQFNLPVWFPSSPKSKLPPKSPFNNRVFAWNYLQSPTQEEIKNFRNENDLNQELTTEKRMVEEISSCKKSPPCCEEALYESISPAGSPNHIVEEPEFLPTIPKINVIPVTTISSIQMHPTKKIYRRDRKIITKPKKHPPPPPLNLKPAVPKKPSFLKNLATKKQQNGSPSTTPTESCSPTNVQQIAKKYEDKPSPVTPTSKKQNRPSNVKSIRGMFETGNFSSPPVVKKQTSLQKSSTTDNNNVPEVAPKPKTEPVYDDPTSVQKPSCNDTTDGYCEPSHHVPYDSVPTENIGPYAVVNLDPTNSTESVAVKRKKISRSSKDRRKIYENIAANKNAGEITDGSNTSGDSGYSPRDSKNFYSAEESDDNDPIAGDSDFSDDESLSDQEKDETKQTQVNDLTTFTSDYQKVAYEVLTSERTYIEKLHLLDQVFRRRIDDENREKQFFPPEVINLVFSNISSIYSFHKEFLLPQLEERMIQWESKPRIGDIMKLLAPFLRMYSDYVGNFENAVKQLQTWTSKSSKFATLIHEIQADPLCHHLSLQHHMLEPVQRVPRYQLLLRDYLKKLPGDSEDKTDACKALDLISAAAQHSNDFMKSMDKFQKLLKINEMIDGEDIIDPTREFLKEGKITKIAARSGDQQERYLFLFNDVLFCTQNRKLITGGTSSYKVKARLDIDGMKIFDGENSKYDHTFRLESKQKTLELQGSSDDEKESWMRAILGAIQELLRRKETFKALSVDKDEMDSRPVTESGEDSFHLGLRAPRWIRDDEATMCMRCALDFGLTRRRHHCRACGVVVCSRCSNQQAELAYDSNKPGRVCRKCYVKLKGIDAESPLSPEEKKLSFTEEDTLFGSTMFIQQKSGWNKLWAVVTAEDLHLVRAPKDVRAVVSIPLSFYNISDIDSGDVIDRPFAFKLIEKSGKNIYYLSTECKELKKKWMAYLQEGIPDDSGRACTL
ncbi:uncharacterized protein [Antedon mediterranea]|uniref:uncharacterized protein isoform X3 n=1 Tax=Antedon mediterranea TaxID=105859 RepID=UPI003AF8A682